MWVALKCKNCHIEWADPDIEVDDIELNRNIILDCDGQYETICDEC